jgi:lipid-A-disaccharide synthase
MIVAGEASGDLHGGGVAEELRALAPARPLVGIGGTRMEAAGVTVLERVERLAVMGFVEVLKHVPKHWALLRRLKARLRSGQVGLVIVIDYPGFNMKLAGAAKEAGVPVLYYVTPQVWAWGAGRLPKLASLITKAAPILPFEEALLREHGIDATFVGHPLLDRAARMPSRAEARRQLGIDPNAPVLALFPGSRAQEISRHLDAFVAVGREMQRRVPNLQVIVSVASTIDIDAARCPFPMVRGQSFPLLRAADAAMCKSGTTTLEAAVAGCPLVVAYRTSGWTYWIARRVVKIPHIGLVNVVAGREVAREFVQGALEPRAVSDELERLLSPSSARRAEVERGLAEVRAKLGTPGAAGRVARLALEIAK